MLKLLRWEGWSLVTAVVIIAAVVGLFYVCVLPIVEQHEVDAFKERQRMLQKDIDDGLKLPPDGIKLAGP